MAQHIVSKNKYGLKIEELIMEKARHPAKYTDSFIPIFYERLKDTRNVLDPFAGTGKIGMLKNYGYNGKIYANEIEPEWLSDNEYNCDVLTYQDAEFLNYPSNYFDAICTSPTYGNRMADHHNAKDGSTRNTYTHCLGKQLKDGNTGKMQWGNEYRDKHKRIYAHLSDLLVTNGLFVINVKNHIRKGVEIDVVDFHRNLIESLGFELLYSDYIKTSGLKYGNNSDRRVDGEYILTFMKG